MENKITIGAMLAMMVFFVQDCVRHPIECVETKRVKMVGGCDRWGECGVMYEDGSFGSTKIPTVGQSVCTKWESKR
jgi:hypothetical protein